MIIAAARVAVISRALFLVLGERRSVSSAPASKPLKLVRAFARLMRPPKVPRTLTSTGLL